MGYSHYWYRPPSIPRKQFDRFTTFASAILAALPEVAPDGGGTEKPLVLVPNAPDTHIVQRDVVAFEGGAGLGYETFVVDRVVPRSTYRPPSAGGLAFECCKTARRPYDLAVVAMICALLDAVPAARAESDGSVHDRAGGIRLFEYATGLVARRWSDTEPTLPEWDAFAARLVTEGGDGGLVPPWGGERMLLVKGRIVPESLASEVR